MCSENQTPCDKTKVRRVSISTKAPRSCTVFVMTPPNELTSEGGRDDRGVPYHAESTLSSAQVLKFLVLEARDPRGPGDVTKRLVYVRTSPSSTHHGCPP